MHRYHNKCKLQTKIILSLIFYHDKMQSNVLIFLEFKIKGIAQYQEPPYTDQFIDMEK
jgi:hypothetical protein